MGLLLKNCFEPFHHTNDDVCGAETGRTGNGFVFSRYSKNNQEWSGEALISEIERRGWFVDPLSFKSKLDLHDERLGGSEHGR